MSTFLPTGYEDVCTCMCHRAPPNTVFHCVPCCYPGQIVPSGTIMPAKPEMVIISVDSDDVIPVGDVDGS